MENYHYVNQSDTYSIVDVNDAEDFELTLQCMKNVNFSDDEIQQTLDAVVAILMLGNVEFGMITDTQPGPSADSKELLQTAAKLLGVELKNLIKAMTTKKSIVMKEVMISELTLEQSYMARDALCKDLYGSLFSWIIKKVNATISVGDSSKSKNKKTNFIGLLDIFGFEIF